MNLGGYRLDVLDVFAHWRRDVSAGITLPLIPFELYIKVRGLLHIASMSKDSLSEISKFWEVYIGFRLGLWDKQRLVRYLIGYLLR
jgi:hypothetical protein